MVRAIMMLVMEIMTMLTSSNTGTEKLLQQKDTCANLCQFFFSINVTKNWFRGVLIRSQNISHLGEHIDN